MPRQQVDAANDQTISITGCQEIELLFFGLKESLVEIHLGQWVYDDLLVYIGEMCKKIQILEVNSDKITDISITSILRKLPSLRVLDLSDCPNFVGVSFSDALEDMAPQRLQKVILGPSFQGHSMQVAKQKLLSKYPHVVVEMNDRKKYHLHARTSIE